MIKTHILLKALSYMLIPTISVLGLIFIGFLDWGKFSAFVTSDNEWAILLRIVMALAEIILTYLMYEHYLKEEVKTKGKDAVKDKIKTVTGRRQYYDDLPTVVGDSILNIYSTACSNVWVVEKTIKTD